MDKNKKTKNKPPSPVDQWLGVNRELSFQKKINILLYLMCGASTLLIAILLFRSPIVAVLNDEQIVMLKTKRKALPIGEKQIERVVKEFIRQRYQWTELKPKEISKKMAPFVTDGLKKKLKSMLDELKTKKLKDKKVSQEITDVKVNVTEKGVIANFYKVLVVENLPLVIPTGVMLAVVKGAQTIVNPEGVYVNRVLESSLK